MNNWFLKFLVCGFLTLGIGLAAAWLSSFFFWKPHIQKGIGFLAAGISVVVADFVIRRKFDENGIYQEVYFFLAHASSNSRLALWHRPYRWRHSFIVYERLIFSLLKNQIIEHSNRNILIGFELRCCFELATLLTRHDCGLVQSKTQPKPLAAA